MPKPRLLDLFCGAGGASMGYSRAGFEVVGVDIAPQPNYPFEFHQADALDFDLGGFDAIHASPPCQAYIERNKSRVTDWPKLIEPIRHRLFAANVPYVIENVMGAPLDKAHSIVLCGTMFGLLVLRHRRFEFHVKPSLVGAGLYPPKCNHWGTVADGDFAAVYGFEARGRWHKANDDITDRTRVRDRTVTGPPWDVAMDIDWMDKQELSQAIPPAYTKFIGNMLIGAAPPISR